MDFFLFIFIAFVGGLGLGALLRGRAASPRNRDRDAPPAAAPADRKPPAEPASDSPAAAAPTAPPPESPSGEPLLTPSPGEKDTIYTLATRLDPVLRDVGHPRDILEHADFKQALAELDNVTETELIEYCLGNNWVLGCLAAEALTRREPRAEHADKLLPLIRGGAYLWPLFFLLRPLARIDARPLIGPVLAGAQDWWSTNPLAAEIIGAFIAERLARDEQPTFAGALDERPAKEVQHVEAFLKRIANPALAPLTAELETWRAGHADLKFLRSIGRIYADQDLRIQPYRTERVREDTARMAESLAGERPRSILLVGESGVGKSALRLAFAGQLRAAGWTVFETSAAHIIAGQKYIGEIEAQVKRLARNLEVGKRIVLFIDRLNELQHAGRTQLNPEGVLDQLWPALERRELFLVAEVTPPGYQALLAAHPGLPTVLNVVHVEPADDVESLALAEQLLTDAGPELPQSERTALARETLQLARQYLTYKAAPGSVLGLLGVTLKRLADHDEVIGRADLLATVSQLTGLPVDVLDERQQLDVAALEARFKREVIGQPEAVACLIERIAMLKAGLTDASRPIGVFLFAGPTGTGKTEIAKTLADILFGSPERMIRLDMSEYQTVDSLPRLLGQPGEGGDVGSLAAQIRKQPFSVVLLDEFEKAHHRIWDIFLQVFDDGRLTDARGSLADFRHSIIVLTSNLGATLQPGGGIGFTSTGQPFAAAEVLRAIERTFRKEFLNRLDRVVVFQPLSRQVMRAILRKELDRVLSRRGFRNRDWAVEWEDSAIEFLLDQGFTPDLGARPLRRAIDRYLLAPLSFTIVEHQFPEGDQFLFVRSDGERIQVEFVDPDAEGPAPQVTVSEPAERPAEGRERGLGLIILDPRGNAEEQQLLAARAAPLIERVTNLKWARDKQALLETMNQQSFWDRDDRHGVLGMIEHMDRIESAAAGLRSLLERLARSPGSRQLTGEVAEKLYLLETACADLEERRPTQAFLELRARLEGDASIERAFLERLTAMYERWAKKRRMRFKLLAAQDGLHELTRIFAVSGFGAWSILASEHGLHVFETPRGEGAFDRSRIRVRVAGQPDLPAGSQERWLVQAGKALAAAGEGAEIVRRYREQPSPLVRDFRGWRTGRLDRVLDGDFDLFGLDGAGS